MFLKNYAIGILVDNTMSFNENIKYLNDHRIISLFTTYLKKEKIPYLCFQEGQFFNDGTFISGLICMCMKDETASSTCDLPHTLFEI